MRNLPDLWQSSSLFRAQRNPFRELQKQMDRVFDDFSFPYEPDLSKMTLTGPAFTPSCDVDETDTHYLMSFDLPGVKKDDIKVELRENQLTVSGERKEEREEKNKNRTRSERFYGSFERSFTLPGSMKAEQIEANYSDGVLRLTVPKTEAAKTQQIKIGEGKPKAIQVQEKKSAA